MKAGRQTEGLYADSHWEHFLTECEAQIQGGSVLENISELAHVEEERDIAALVEEYTGSKWRTCMQLHDEELMQGQT